MKNDAHLIWEQPDWNSVDCPYCIAGRGDSCRSRTTGNTVGPHTDRVLRVLRERKEKDAANA
jgi:hypothetical protein